MITSGDPIAEAIGPIVDAGEIAGAVTLVWHRGGVLQSAALGWRDLEAKLPMERDSIFRIASMSKPITSAAALMLLEEGRFSLDEPIAAWAPEFAQMRVLRSPDAPLDDTDQAQRQVTFEDLLTHRSGLTYGDFHTGPIADAYRKGLGGGMDSKITPDDWIGALAQLPVIAQPGTGFHYGVSTDLLGLIIARMEDRALSDVLEQRIFTPLGMSDTGFCVPKGKWSRRAKLYGFDEAGRLTHLQTAPGEATLPERPQNMEFASGGAGLWSTLDDFGAFARLFIGEGAVDGVRLLAPKTLALMTGNRLTERQRAEARMFGYPVFGSGNGYGLGVAVVLDPETASPLRGRGGIGTVGWPGAYGGWWQADPTNDSVMIFLAQNALEPDQIAKGIGLEVYGAIMEFQTLASRMTR